ncbi:MAG: LPS export ABC transporter ATP-binding protein [Verrucomicrobiota bacterium]
MSYSDDPDDLSEILGLDKEVKGYSKELDELDAKLTPEKKPNREQPEKAEGTQLPPRRKSSSLSDKIDPRRRPKPASTSSPPNQAPSKSEPERKSSSEPRAYRKLVPSANRESLSPPDKSSTQDKSPRKPSNNKPEATATAPADASKKSQASDAPPSKLEKLKSKPEVVHLTGLKDSPSTEPATKPLRKITEEKSSSQTPRSIPVSDSSSPKKKTDLKASSRSSLPIPESSRSPSPEGEFLLETNGLVKVYDGRTVVNGVEIKVRPGEIVGLLGPNGAGKTTSFYMIVGLVPPNGGQVLFDSEDVTQLPMYQRARLGMGYLPQEESIFRKLTVEENIMAVMETLDLSREERVRRCDELLERFSITHIRKNIALTCSGGEKRRLTIARSLVTEPSLLMLDEPFSGVDPIAVNEIQSIVEDLRKSGLAILITDHNARQTLELVDRAYLIYEGKVLREGPREFLINDPVSRELYLGDRFTM